METSIAVVISALAVGVGLKPHELWPVRIATEVLLALALQRLLHAMVLMKNLRGAPFFFSILNAL